MTAPDASGGTIVVTGHVVDGLPGHPAPATVRIGTKETTTDALGDFELAGIAPPYDVCVDFRSMTYDVTFCFLQVTRPDPTLHTLIYGYYPRTPTFERQALIDWEIRRSPALVALGPLMRYGPYLGVLDGASAEGPVWNGPFQTTVSGVAFEHETSGDVWGAGSYTNTVHDGGHYNWALDLAAVPNETIEVLFEPPAGGEPDGEPNVLWVYGVIPGVAQPVEVPLDSVRSNLSEVVNVPAIEGATFVVQARTLATQTVRSGVHAGEQLALAFPEVPVPSQVANDELDISSAVLSWTGRLGSVTRLSMRYPGDRLVVVVTRANEFDLRTFAEVEPLLVSGSRLTWSVYQYPLVESMDDATSPSGYHPTYAPISLAPSAVPGLDMYATSISQSWALVDSP